MHRGVLINYVPLCHFQEEVKKELDLLLSRHCQLDAKIRGITKVLPNLEVIHSDTLKLADMLKVTSTLAENISAKVRVLDTARVSQKKSYLFYVLTLDY